MAFRMKYTTSSACYFRLPTVYISMIILASGDAIFQLTIIELLRRKLFLVSSAQKGEDALLKSAWEEVCGPKAAGLDATEVLQLSFEQ